MPAGKCEWPTAVTIPSGGWLRNDLWPDETIDMLAMQNRINQAAYGSGFPQRWFTGVPPAPAIKSYPFINDRSDNERSKPVGLTKEYVYNDDNNGRTLRVEKSADNPRSVFLQTASKDVGVGAGVWLNEADMVPLAINVLGYDRPTVGDWALASVVVVRGDGHRERVLDEALANLKAVDLYDQRADERKAAEERAAKLTADLKLASQRLRNVSESVADYGVTAFRAEELADAASSYKAAYDAHAGG